MQMSPANISLTLCAVACLVLLTRYVLAKKENKLLSDQLTETSIQLATNKKKLSELQGRYNDISHFQKSIEQAELTTRFQSPRLQAARLGAGTHSASQIPEKYSYIHSLTEKGMSAEEIASVLSISSHEASQLVTLTRINPHFS